MVNRSRRAQACLVGYALASTGDVIAELLHHEWLVGTLPIILMPLLAGYLWWSSPPSRLSRPGPLVAYAVAMIALIGLVAGQAGALWLPIVVYGSSLFLMVALASGISRLTLVGALLFVASDLTIAYGAFLDAAAGERNGPLIMASYLTAQLLLVLGPRRWAARVSPAPDPYLAGRR